MIVTKELAEFIAEELKKGERFSIGGEEFVRVGTKHSLLMCRFYKANGSYTGVRYGQNAALGKIYE